MRSINISKYITTNNITKIIEVIRLQKITRAKPTPLSLKKRYNDPITFKEVLRYLKPSLRYSLEEDVEKVYKFLVGSREKLIRLYLKR